MRLITFRRNGHYGLGALMGESVLDLSSAFQILFPTRDPDDPGLPATMTSFLRMEDLGIARAQAVLERVTTTETLAQARHPLKDIEILAPIPRPGKILAVDYNYQSFINDARRLLYKQGLDVPNWTPPKRPWLFGKFSTTVVGPGAAILRPRGTQSLDAEGELAVVIGKSGRFISESDALDYIAGYTLFNDVSDRSVEFRPSPSINHRLFVLGKNNDTFGPMGPCLFTPDEIGDPNTLSLEVLVNGKLMYRYTTRDALFSVQALVSFCSQAFRLDPGDVISTGSGGGCGVFQDPPHFLCPGDSVTVRIPGLAELENPVEEEPSQLFDESK